MNSEKTLRFAISVLLGLQPLLFSAAKASALEDQSAAAKARLTETAERTQAALGEPSAEGMSHGLSRSMDGAGHRRGPVRAGHDRDRGRDHRGRLEREATREEHQPGDSSRLQNLTSKPEPPKGSAVRDTSKEENAGKESEFLQNLKKDAIGGAFGAVGLGILGFVLGGPAGALMGAMLGFAVFGAVTHLNNNL